MNFKINISFFVLSTILFCSCQKNIDIFVPDPGQTAGPDTSWTNNIVAGMPVSSLQNSLMVETFKKDIEVGIHKDSSVTANGLTCYFPAGNYLSSGNVVVTGKISSEVLLLRKKGDMIRMNKPTVSNNRLLVSNAAVFVRLKDTQNIALAPGTLLDLKINDAGTIANNIAFFSGEDLQNGGFNWSVNNDPTNNFIASSISPLQITTNKLRWTSAAYFFDTMNISRNILTLSLPSNYTNANTIVYVVFKDLRSVVALTADVASKKFTSIKLPDGKAITVVAISHQANDYYLGTMAITTGTSTNISLVPTKSSLVNINTLLDSL